MVDHGDGDPTGDEPALGGPGRAAPGGSEPWLGGEHGIQQALEALTGGNDRAIWRAGRSLAAAGAMATPRLCALLAHPDYRVRAVAAWSLQQTAADEGAPAAAPALAERLGAPRQVVRVAAANALRAISQAHPGAAPEAEAALRAYRRGRP